MVPTTATHCACCCGQLPHLSARSGSADVCFDLRCLSGVAGTQRATGRPSAVCLCSDADDLHWNVCGATPKQQLLPAPVLCLCAICCWNGAGVPTLVLACAASGNDRSSRAFGTESSYSRSATDHMVEDGPEGVLSSRASACEYGAAPSAGEYLSPRSEPRQRNRLLCRNRKVSPCCRAGLSVIPSETAENVDDQTTWRDLVSLLPATGFSLQETSKAQPPERSDLLFLHLGRHRSRARFTRQAAVSFTVFDAWLDVPQCERQTGGSGQFSSRINATG